MKSKIEKSIVAQSGSTISNVHNNSAEINIKFVRVQSLVIGFIVGILTSIIASYIYDYLNQ